MPAKRIPARTLDCAHMRAHQFVHARALTIVCVTLRLALAGVSVRVVYGTPADTHLRRGQRGTGFKPQESRSLGPDLYQLGTVYAVLEGSNRRLRVQYALFDFDHRHFHLGVPKDLAGPSKLRPDAYSRCQLRDCPHDLS